MVTVMELAEAGTSLFRSPWRLARPRPRRHALVFVLAAMPALASPAHATRVLVRTGVRVGNKPALDRIEMVNAGEGGVTFLGGTSAVLTRTGSAWRVIARTGDRLPRPLSGTFDTFLEPPFINDAGMVAFRATLSSRKSHEGIFLHDGAHLAVLEPDGVPSGARLLGLDRVGDVLFERVEQAGGGELGAEIGRWDRARKAPVRIVASGDPAPDGVPFYALGEAAMNGDGKVAFVAVLGPVAGLSGRRVGIFTADPGSGILPVAVVDDPCAPLPFCASFTDETVAINEAGMVAFAGDDPAGVFRYDPVTATTTTIAGLGDVIAGQALTRIDSEWVGIDSRGSVAFLGTLATTRWLILFSDGISRPLAPLDESSGPFSSTSSDASRVIWQSGNSIKTYDGAVMTVLDERDPTPLGRVVALSGRINDRGTLALTVRRDCLYRLRHGPECVLGTGEEPPIADIVAVAEGRHGTAFMAAPSTGGWVVDQKRPGRASTRLVTRGDPTPLGGTFADDTWIVGFRGQHLILRGGIDVDGDQLPDESAILDLDTSTGATRVVVKSGDVAPGSAPINFIDQTVALRKGVAFKAHLADDSWGLFVADASGLSRVAAEGGVAPGGTGLLSDLDEIVTNGTEVVMRASACDPCGPLYSFFTTFVSWSDRAVTRFPVDAPARMCPNAYLLGLSDSGDALLDDDGGLLVCGGQSLRRVVAEGDSAGGGRISTLGSSAVFHNSVIYVAGLEGARSPSALFHAGLRRGRGGGK